MSLERGTDTLTKIDLEQPRFPPQRQNLTSRLPASPQACPGLGTTAHLLPQTHEPQSHPGCLPILAVLCGFICHTFSSCVHG